MNRDNIDGDGGISKEERKERYRMQETVRKVRIEWRKEK